MKENYDADSIFTKIFENLSHEEVKEIRTMKSSQTLYEDLAESIFPAIFGHL